MKVQDGGTSQKAVNCKINKDNNSNRPDTDQSQEEAFGMLSRVVQNMYELVERSDGAPPAHASDPHPESGNQDSHQCQRNGCYFFFFFYAIGVQQPYRTL